MALLSDAAAKQERWRAQNGSYATIVSDLRRGYGDLSEHGYCKLTVTADNGYTLTASRNGPQANDKKCGNYTLNALGTKGMADGTPGTLKDCWR
ncbi:hypothetical protein G7047_23170 [Diaphorobacter sp. HDW4A]|nr:hypothetical protein G7047_23170 [Diaphorobacter sp. HDW4A]